MSTITKFYASAMVMGIVGILASVASADGMIVPVRPELRVRGAWAVKYHHVDITVRDQVASVSIDQEFIHTGEIYRDIVRPMPMPMPGRPHPMPRERMIAPMPPPRMDEAIEVEYFFPVPPDAAVDSMTLMVDGKEFAAKLYKADEARKIYEEIVRTKKDPALLEYVGFGLLKTSAFPLQPGKPCRVAITYKNTCKKDRDVVEVWYPLNTEKFSSKAIEEVRVKVDIKAGADILSLYSPTHDLDVRKDKDDPRHITAIYQAKDTLPISDFQVFYKAADDKVGATLLTYQPAQSKDGYFLMLVSPNPRSGAEKIIAKDVVLVLDTSGSMTGEKISQAKAAATFVLRNLNDKDRFNVITFNDSCETFFDKLVDADKGKVEKAIQLVDRIEARGGTNTHDAMQMAMKMTGQNDRPKYVIFMTDGQPTVGKTSEVEILADTRKANEFGAHLFAFGVGYDVNTRLLDKLVGDHGGKSDYVKPKEAIEGKISSLYSKIKNPVMTGLKVEIKGLKLKEMYPRNIGDLFDGDQIVLAGRYDPDGLGAMGKVEIQGDVAYQTQLVVTGKYDGAERAFEYPVAIRSAGKDCRYQFVEKLWAIRRVGYLLDEIQFHGKNQELIDELIRLSRDYGIMTPYTSFLADERTDLNRPSAAHGATEAMDSLAKYEGASGQLNAVARQTLNNADRAQASSVDMRRLNAAAKSAAGGPTAAPAAISSGGTMVLGNSNTADYEGGKQEVVANVRQVGNQSMYRRGNTWMTVDVARQDIEKDKPNVVTVERFSPEYFELVKLNTVSENQVISSQQEGEELLLTLRGQMYRIR